jgi:hypothetical protein
MCIVLLIAIPVGLLIGALILRAAVWLANKCLPQPRARYYDEDDYEDEWDSYDRPRRTRRGGGRAAIPEPTLGRAMLIVFVVWIANVVVGFMMGFVAGAGGLVRNQAGMVGLQGCSLVINFLIAASILTPMLPTTFPRACLVVLFQFLIGLVIVIIIVVPIVAVFGLAAWR